MRKLEEQKAVGDCLWWKHSDSSPAGVNREKGRPKEDRETKKRVSLSVLPSLYEDVQKIAYVQRRSVSDIMSELMEGYGSENVVSISEFDVITKH